MCVILILPHITFLIFGMKISKVPEISEKFQHFPHTRNLIPQQETLFMRSLCFVRLLKVSLFLAILGITPILAAQSELDVLTGGALTSPLPLPDAETGAAEPVKTPVEIQTSDDGNVSVVLKLDSDAVQTLVKQGHDVPEVSEFVTPVDENIDVIEVWDSIRTHFFSFCNLCRQNTNKIILFMFGVILTWVGTFVLRTFCDRVLYKKVVLKTETLADDYLYKALMPPILAFFWCLGIFLSALPFWNQIGFSQRLILLLISLDVTWLLYRLIGALDHLICSYFRGKKRVFNKLIFDAIRKTARVAVILFAVCFIGQTILGLNISAILAAAGVFGLAVAFAVKDTISNFLSSFMMLFDNSFQMGDRIRTKNIDGEVEAVDFRSTRIRALNGHLFSVPNSILGAEIVENVSQRPGIRYDFELTLTYDTTPEQMEHALAVIRELTSSSTRFLQQAEKKLITFASFSDWSLNIKVMVWFNTRSFIVSEEWKNDLNLAILRRFTEDGLNFAYPTRTVILQKDPVPNGAGDSGTK